jgi:hypothetical protein
MVVVTRGGDDRDTSLKGIIYRVPEGRRLIVLLGRGAGGDKVRSLVHHAFNGRSAGSPTASPQTYEPSSPA